MTIVLTISICLNIGQAFIFWFFMIGLALAEKRKEGADNEIR